MAAGLEAAMRKDSGAAGATAQLPAWLLPEDIGKRFGEVKVMAESHGRDPEQIHLGIEVYGCIDQDGAKARQDGYGTLAIGPEHDSKNDERRDNWPR